MFYWQQRSDGEKSREREGCNAIWRDYLSSHPVLSSLPASTWFYAGVEAGRSTRLDTPRGLTARDGERTYREWTYRELVRFLPIVLDYSSLENGPQETYQGFVAGTKSRDAWRETCLSQRLSRRRVSINCSSDHIMCRLVARSWICCTSCRFAWIGERKRERENGRGMFLQRVSRMSHERVTRDLWKLENRARSWSIGIRFRLGYIHFSFFSIFPSFFYDFLEEESEPRKGSINSSRSNVAIFRFIETTHSPFKKRFTYAPMGCSRHQVARGKYQLRVMKPRFSAERYTYYMYIFIACIVAHSIECCAITYTYPPFWLIFPGSWINL